VILDCHVHLNNYDDEGEHRLAADVAALQSAMRRNNVDAAIILTSYRVAPGRPSTRQVLEAIRGVQNLHVVAGVPFATLSPAAVDELDELLTAGAIKGLKLYPGYEPFYPADEMLAPLYALAARHDVPVMIHCGDTYSATGKVKYAHPLHVDEVAVDHPDVRFVICHLGNPWFADCMELVYKNPNVYADISGLALGNFTDRFEAYMRRELQEILVWGVNPEHVLYGSDWPISSMESYVEFMEDLKVPVKEKQAILWHNAAKLFKIPPPPSHSGLGALLGGL
jgi:hypothetical protein